MLADRSLKEVTGLHDVGMCLRIYASISCSLSLVANGVPLCCYFSCSCRAIVAADATAAVCINPICQHYMMPAKRDLVICGHAV